MRVSIVFYYNKFKLFIKNDYFLRLDLKRNIKIVVNLKLFIFLIGLWILIFIYSIYYNNGFKI